MIFGVRRRLPFQQKLHDLGMAVFGSRHQGGLAVFIPGFNLRPSVQQPFHRIHPAFSRRLDQGSRANILGLFVRFPDKCRYEEQHHYDGKIKRTCDYRFPHVVQPGPGKVYAILSNEIPPCQRIRSDRGVANPAGRPVWTRAVPHRPIGAAR